MANDLSWKSPKAESVTQQLTGIWNNVNLTFFFKATLMTMTLRSIFSQVLSLDFSSVLISKYTLTDYIWKMKSVSQKLYVKCSISTNNCFRCNSPRSRLFSGGTRISVGAPTLKEGDNLLFGQNLPKATWKWNWTEVASKILLCRSANAIFTFTLRECNTQHWL